MPLWGWQLRLVSKRLQEPTDRNDLLSKLQVGKDEDVSSFFADCFCHFADLLISQGVTQWAAKSSLQKRSRFSLQDLIPPPSRPISIPLLRCVNLMMFLSSTCAIIYYLARTPSVQQKLHKELDDHLVTDVATAERVKKSRLLASGH